MRSILKNVKAVPSVHATVRLELSQAKRKHLIRLIHPSVSSAVPVWVTVPFGAISVK